ncbi:MAG: HEPN domain-containing protein [Deltaproteobacteria bacterium]|nr:HEPN domain-containing protein [Deltaproteobacteria bacterium]
MKSRDRSLAQEWLERAKSDFLYAQAGEKETGQHHVTCFLCHQSAEKLLKGLLVLADEVPQKTHHLAFLISKVASHYPSFAEFKREIRRLDKFYVPSRYPDNTLLEFTPEDAKEALLTVKKMTQLAETEVKSVLKSR